VHTGVVAAYPQHRKEEANTFSVIRASVQALRAAHCTLQLPDPTRDPVVDAVVAQAQRSLPANVNRLDPISAAALQALLQQTLCLEAPLIEVVVAAAGVFIFCNFTHFDEMKSVTMGGPGHWSEQD
jgi:hypothetical protein